MISNIWTVLVDYLVLTLFSKNISTMLYISFYHYSLVLTLFSKNISTMLYISFYHYSPDRNIFDKLLFIVHSAFIHNISPLIHSYDYQTRLDLSPPPLWDCRRNWSSFINRVAFYCLIDNGIPLKPLSE